MNKQCYTAIAKALHASKPTPSGDKMLDMARELQWKRTIDSMSQSLSRNKGFVLSVFESIAVNGYGNMESNKQVPAALADLFH